MRIILFLTFGITLLIYNSCNTTRAVHQASEEASFELLYDSISALAEPINTDSLLSVERDTIFLAAKDYEIKSDPVIDGLIKLKLKNGRVLEKIKRVNFPILKLEIDGRVIDVYGHPIFSSAVPDAEYTYCLLRWKVYFTNSDLLQISKWRKSKN